MTITLAASSGKSACSAARLICAPRPFVGQHLAFEGHVLGDDAGVPRAARRRHPAGDQVRETRPADRATEALPAVQAVAARRLAQIGGDGHRAGDDVEQDVPLRAQQHQHDAAPAERDARQRRSTAITSGKSIGAGNDAATCTTGWKMRDSRGERPMARPAGSVQSVPSAVESSTRPSVQPHAPEHRPVVAAGAVAASSIEQPPAAEERGRRAARRTRHAARAADDDVRPDAALRWHVMRAGASDASAKTLARARCDPVDEQRAPEPVEEPRRRRLLARPPSSTRNFCAQTTTGRHRS